MKKILIVEDNKDLRDVYKLIFEDEGFESRASNNGESALSSIENFEPDFILLDIMMPNVSGFDFLKEFNKKYGDNKKPIIGINTNLSSDDVVIEGLKLGCDHFFRKTDYTPFELVKKVREILAE